MLLLAGGLLSQCGCGQSSTPLGPGALAPPLTAPGWLNGKAPAEADLAGKVVVVELWAYWCGYCPANAQELIKLEKEYRGQDVVFVAFTPDGNESKLSSQEWLQAQGVPWPSGYGATEVINQLRAPGFPMTYVIGRDNRVVWHSLVPGDIHAAIDTALARQP
ncbi:MAG: peroxiredoxin family protein [Pirellulales bacterium]